MIRKNVWLKLLLIVLCALVSGLVNSGCNLGNDDSGSSVTVSAPSNLTGTVSSGSIMINWQDNSNNETNFCLYVKSYDATSWTLYSNVIPASATSYSFPSNKLGYTGSNFQFFLTTYDGNDGVESAASNIISLSW